MADSSVTITQGAGTSVDTRTVGGEHRQVVVIGDPTINADVAAVASQDVASSDQSTPAVLVRLAGSATVVGLQGSTARPLIVNTDGALKIYDIVTGTIATVSTITGIDRVRNVIDGTLTTITGIDRVRNIVDGTISLISTITGIDRVRNVVDGTISLVSTVTGVDRIRNVVDGTISFVPVVQRVQNVVDGTLTVVTTVGRVNNIVDGTISLANIQATAVVAAAGGSIAGSTAGVSVSGVTIKAPVSGRNIKIYAFSLTTTAQAHIQARFTDGNGASPTTLWQVGLQAPTQGIAGANLAVTPPGFLFATGTGNTLALVKDTGSLVHYSVAYFLESA